MCSKLSEVTDNSEAQFVEVKAYGTLRAVPCYTQHIRACSIIVYMRLTRHGVTSGKWAGGDECIDILFLDITPTHTFLTFEDGRISLIRASSWMPV